LRIHRIHKIKSIAIEKKDEDGSKLHYKPSKAYRYEDSEEKSEKGHSKSKEMIMRTILQHRRKVD